MTGQNKETVPFSTNESTLVNIGTDLVTVLLSATLLSLPIENGSFWPFAFVALVPILLRMWTRGYWAIFCMGFSTFFLYLYLALQWIDEYGFHWRVTLVFMNAVSPGLMFVLFFFIIRRFKAHFFATVLATLFTLLDYKQSLGFFGFPWPLICHSQAGNLPLIQIASITGCWGVSFIVILVNEALSHLIAGKFHGKILGIAVLPVVLIGTAGLYGALSLAKPVEGHEINATVVQWDQATNREWTSEFVDASLQAYSEITKAELTPDPAAANLPVDPDIADNPRLVVWPETAVPHAIRNQYTMLGIQGFAREFDMTLVIGCLTQFPGEGGALKYETAWEWQDVPKEYNTMVAFDPDGSVKPMYSKIHLVPFGEVIPMKKYIVDWFPQYPWGNVDASPGTGFYVTDTQVGKLGAVVCYESFFPQYARMACVNGAEILVLGSNTSWFGRTRASYQHARFDAFRAVENRIWFCRAATTGVSSIIDPQGRPHRETELFKSDAITLQINRRKETTFYTRHGDWLPAICAAFFALLSIGILLIKKSGN